MPTAKKQPAAKQPATKKPAAKKAAPSERETLLAALSDKLHAPADEIELRALRELAERHGLHGDKAGAKSAAAESDADEAPHGVGGLPARLYVLLDGRGIDRGLPIEVLQSPTLIGSGRMCQIWINSPQIETRHAQITEEDGRWVMTDLNTEKGTLFGDEPLQRRVLRSGDEFRLAGYLRMRVEFH